MTHVSNAMTNNIEREISSQVGLISLTLGSIGLLLFFLPILGIPLGAIGLVVGIAGMTAALLGAGTSLRWSAVGLGVCLVALTLDVLVAYAPLLLVPNSAVAPQWQSLPNRTYVAPPARPERSQGEEQTRAASQRN